VAVLATALLAPLSGHGAQEPERELMLWYDRPAAAFEEALHWATGRLGAMIFGQTRLRADHASTSRRCGPGGPSIRPSTRMPLPPCPRCDEALFRGDYALADQLTRKLQGRFSESYAPLGDLVLRRVTGCRHADYAFRRELDIGTAVVERCSRLVAWSSTREYFVSYPDPRAGSAS